MTGLMIVAILVAMVIASIVVVVVGRQDEQRREERRRRFELTDTGQRVPLAPARTERPPAPLPDDAATFMPDPPPLQAGYREQGERAAVEVDGESGALLLTPERPPLPPLGRFVNTPDGEKILTTPPFALRETVLTKRNGRYALALLRRLPPWIVISPKVRLDSLLTPTSPDGRDPEDWRQWRHRVRLRAIDLLLCDRRTWRPVLAIMIDRDLPARASAIAGGKDRIIDEVLSTVGLPLVRGSGLFKNDWPLIRPYVEQATLASAPRAADDALHGGQGWDASAAITLLRMDDEKGWLLE